MMTVKADEIEKFSRDSAHWWDPNGPFKPLHKLNPVRMGHIRDELRRVGAGDAPERAPLQGLRVLDVGCGGGLVCEPLTRLGADVTGIDADAGGVAAAEAHAAEQGLAIAYRHADTATLVEEGLAFDAVTALEIIEHVDDPRRFVAELAALTRPGGRIVFSTINKTWRALALAKVAAEYVLRWVPRGTHDPRMFVRPDDLAAHARAAGLMPRPPVGLVYRPLADRFELSRDCSVNYFLTVDKPD